MNTDIRLSVSFWSCPKVKKLIRRAGLEAARSLQVLWLWATVSRPSGDLDGMDGEDVELAADWNGDEGAFVGLLVNLGFLDGEEGSYRLHDWLEHNGWAAGESSRSDSGRFSRMKRSLPEVGRVLEEAGIAGISKADYEQLKNPATRKAALERLLGDLGDLGEPAKVHGRSPRKVGVGDLENSPAPVPVPTLKVEKTPPAPPAGEECARAEVALPSDGDAGERDSVQSGRRPAADFMAFWAAFPKQEGRQDAMAVWSRLKASGQLPPVPDLLEAVSRQSEARGWRDPANWRYVPAPAKWLAGKRWETVVPEGAGRPRASPGCVSKADERSERSRQAVLDGLQEYLVQEGIHGAGDERRAGIAAAG